MKMMHGASASACANRSRTRAAPTPTNISTNSEPLRLKKGTLASPATALASSVLPVPGGPTSSTPFGMRPPRVGVLLRRPQELDDLLQLLLGFVDPSHVGEAHLDVVFGEHAMLASGERHYAAFGAADAPEEDAHTPMRRTRARATQEFGEPASDRFAGVLDAGGLELLEELGILDARGGEVGPPLVSRLYAPRIVWSPTETSATCPSVRPA